MWKIVVRLVVTLQAIWVAQCAAISAFCPPDRNIVPISVDNDDTPATFCDCHMAHSAPWGLPTITIDCQNRELHNDDLPHDLILPLAAVEITLAWNNLTSAPTLATSQDLTTLRLAHNAIVTLDGAPFVHLADLRLLDLSFNDIATVSDDAFDGLVHLHHLDLSHNHLISLPSNVFGGLLVLQELILSENSLADFLSQVRQNILSHSLMLIFRKYFRGVIRSSCVDDKSRGRKSRNTMDSIIFQRKSVSFIFTIILLISFSYLLNILTLKWEIFFDRII